MLTVHNNGVGVRWDRCRQKQVTFTLIALVCLPQTVSVFERDRTLVDSALNDENCALGHH